MKCDIFVEPEIKPDDLKFPFTFTRYFNCYEQTDTQQWNEKPQLTTTILTNSKHDFLKTETTMWKNKRKHLSKK